MGVTVYITANNGIKKYEREKNTATCIEYLKMQEF